MVRRHNIPAVAADEVTPRGHIDLSRDELAWLYKEAFGFSMPSDMDPEHAVVSVHIEKGFSWARKKIDDRATRNVNTTHKEKGDPQC